MIEGQLAELVTQEAVELAIEITVYGRTREPSNVPCRVVGGTGVVGTLGTAEARGYLFWRQRPQTIVVREAQIGNQAPDP